MHSNLSVINLLLKPKRSRRALMAHVREQLYRFCDQKRRRIVGAYPGFRRESVKTLGHETIGDIQFAISRSESATDSAPLHENLTQRVQAMVSDFEAHHPKLTANLSYVAERLADMGI